MRRRLVTGIVSLLMVITLATGILAINPSREERDIDQPRLESALLALTPSYQFSQTFTSRHAGLEAIEIILVRYERHQNAPADAGILFTLERLDTPSVVVSTTLPIDGLVHNQVVRFRFPSLPDSQQAVYRLTLSMDADYGVSTWRTSGDAYSGGSLFINGTADAGDLRFATYYDYHLSAMLSDLLTQLRRWLPALAGVLLAFVLPGLALAGWLLPHRRQAWPLFSGYVLALSLVSWPLLYLWASVANVSLAGSRLWFVLTGWLVLGTAGWLRRRRLGRISLPAEGESDHLPEGVLAVVLLLCLATRLLQVRALVLPAWVDSLHHTLLTQLIRDHGMVPADYLPFMPVANLHYHFGFHAGAAALATLAGLTSADAVLLLGQLLGAWAPLAIYVFTLTLTRRRWAGATAAVITGCVSFMPAYYTSWGRYTQLLGLLLLCLLGGVVYELLQTRDSPARERWRALAFCALLIGGLGLSHYRVAIMAVLLIAVLAVATAVIHRFAGWRSMTLNLAAVAFVSILLILPWLLRMATVILQVPAIYNGWEAVEGYNDFPTGLFHSAATQVLLYVGAIGLMWGTACRKSEVLTIGVWSGACLLAANLHLLGLFDFWLLPNSAVAISYWLPLSVLGGWLIAELVVHLPAAVHWIAARTRRQQSSVVATQRAAAYSLAGVLVIVALWGSWQMVDIVNPVTVLATEDDMQAMQWIQANTPSDALFLVNSRVWTNDLHVGSDAGWWLPFVAGRRATMPTILHHQGSRSYFTQVRDLALLVEESKSMDDPALLAGLQAAGVDYVYVGAKGGKLMPAALDASRHYRLVYSNGPTRVYAFSP